ncbi:MAG: M56 family metallopeptidase, partial [Ignavibacteriaceae bacterium]
MNFIDKILPENLIYSIGWTIIHSFWQGAIISLLLIAFFTLVKTSSATKAKAAVIALGVMVILFMVTFSLEMNSYENPQSINNSLQTSAVGEVLSSAPAKSQGNNSEENISSQFGIARELKYFLAQNISLLTFIWFAGFMFFTLRFLGGFYLIRKLKYTGTSFVPAFWQIRVNSLRYKLKISRPVRMLESVNVSIPITIGYVKPVILMPIGMLTGLPANQIGAIIAHELAHIYRNDYLINILQTVGEIILFYHPAAWWISSKIREERENSCDDLAVAYSGDKLIYAHALTNLEELKIKENQFVLAIKKNKTVMNRVKRLFNTEFKETRFSERLIALGI